MNSVLESFRFLSVLPVPGGRADERGLAGAVAWFPLVGAALGGLLALTDYACGKAFPPSASLLTAALVLTVYAVFTGGLHHDAVIDVADAFLARKSTEERLRIMKDPHAGAAGVSAVVLLELVELGAIYALPASTAGAAGHFRTACLVSFPILGRWAMSFMCVRFPYARPEGTAAAMVGDSKVRHLAVSTALTLVALSALFVFLVRIPLLIPVLFVSTLGFAEVAGRLFARSLGGVTGDLIGATGFFVECLVLALLASRAAGSLAG